MRALILLLSTTVLLLGVALVVAVRTPPAPAVVTAKTKAQVMPADEPVVAAPINPIRARIQDAVAAKRPQLRTADDADRFLVELENQARQKHAVTAMETETGILALRLLEPQLGAQQVNEKLDAFNHRMALLSAELDGRATQQPESAEARFAEVQKASPGAARSAAIQRYLTLVPSLPEDEQDRALARLHSL